MASREVYNKCMSPHMKGTGLTKDQRRMKMCIGAKLCTGRASTEKEAIALCNLPREPKAAPKARAKKSRNVDGSALAACIIPSLDGPGMNVGKLTTIISNCLGQKVEKKLTRERFIKKCFKENAVTGDIKEAAKLRSLCTAEWKLQGAVAQ